MYGDVDAQTTTLNLGSGNATIINLGTASHTQIVNIDTGSATKTINIGVAGDTVNFAGTVNSITTSNSNVTNKTMTLNVGGAAGSSTNAGILIEEAGADPGYLEIDGTRDSWLLKAPATAGIITVTPGSAGFTINQGSHNPITINNATPNGLSVDSNQVVSLELASSSTTGALSSTDWNTFNNQTLSGDVTGSFGNTQIGTGIIVNSDINSSADIADSKLATITTAGKVSNSATTATSASNANTIVQRDGSGNFSAGTITATLNGNATSASSATNITTALAGDVGGTITATSIQPGVINNSQISSSAAIADSKLATISSAGKVANSATSATSANTDGTIIARNNTTGTFVGPFGALSIAINTNGPQTNALSVLSGSVGSYSSIGIDCAANEIGLGICVASLT